MDYVFGTKGSGETLKTRGDSHSDLKGFVQLTREYPDQVITDRFNVVRKYQSEDDAGGFKYDWYEIKDHYRYTDKFTPGIVATEQEVTDHDLAILEAEQAITDLDLRVMELELA